MSFMPDFSRRGFIRLAAAAPLLGQLAAKNVLASVASALGKDSRQNVYTRLGVKTIINCRGTWTYLSGSLEFPEVRAAQREASEYFVNMFELQHAASRRLAELTGAEAGMVTSGAAGAMASAAAACVGGRSALDNAIRLTGAKLVLVGTAEELANANNQNTAMIYTTHLGSDLQTENAVAKKYNIPMLLDDAAGIPPIANIKLYAQMGLDMYTFSGGKGLRGPQCSGLLLGRKDLIEAAMLNTSPWEGAVCRAMKVGKEEIVGLLMAVKTWLKTDFDALNREWNARVERIAKLVETVSGVETDISIPKDGNRYPTLYISWDEEKWGFTVKDCVQKLRAGDPVIEVAGADNPSIVPAVREGNPKQSSKESAQRRRLELVSSTIQPHEAIIVGQRIRELLSVARKAAPAAQ